MYIAYIAYNSPASDSQNKIKIKWNHAIRRETEWTNHTRQLEKLNKDPAIAGCQLSQEIGDANEVGDAKAVDDDDEVGDNTDGANNRDDYEGDNDEGDNADGDDGGDNDDEAVNHILLLHNIYPTYPTCAITKIRQ